MDDLDNSNKSSNFNKKITKDEIKHIISGESEIRHGSNIQATTNYLRKSIASSEKAKKYKQVKEQEVQCLEKYATDNNLWIDVDYLKDYYNRGYEQKVYILDGNSVVKLNQTEFYESWIDYFNNLLLHNIFFPDTYYELIGFAKDDDSFCAVVKQPFVEFTEATDLESVKEFMLNNGFFNKKNNDYFNPELGLILEDLHDENVLTRDGVLCFIDTVFYISEPYFYKSGGELNSNTSKFYDRKYIENMLTKSSVNASKNTIFTNNFLVKNKRKMENVIIQTEIYELVRINEPTKLGNEFILRFKVPLSSADNRVISGNLFYIKGHFSPTHDAFVLKSALSKKEIEKMLEGSTLHDNIPEIKKEEVLEENFIDISEKAKDWFDISNNPEINKYANKAVFDLTIHKNMDINQALEEITIGVADEEEHRETIQKVIDGEISIDEAIVEIAYVHIMESENGKFYRK